MDANQSPTWTLVLRDATDARSPVRSCGLLPFHQENPEPRSDLFSGNPGVGMSSISLRKRAISVAKFNSRTKVIAPVVPAPARSFISTATVPTGRTGEKGLGFARSNKSELYTLGLSNFVSEGTFYEDGLARDDRFKGLVHAVVAEDQDWVARWVPWLRGTANMRSASLVAALETASAMVKLKRPGGRQIVASAIRRGDEPGEALSYWTSTYGKKMPKPVKRGIADAARRLYTESNWLKWDSTKSPFRFADVIELCHVKPIDAKQAALFRYIVDARHGHAQEIPSTLTMIGANVDLRNVAIERPEILTETAALKTAGFTWEDALSLLGTVAQEPRRSELKQKVWAATAPNMGYMALLRNLRNISENVTDAAVKHRIADLLQTPEAVFKSRQFPFRFLSASKATSSYGHDWAGPLERAVQLSLQNIPELPGRSLVLVDISGSMADRMSAQSEMQRVEVAGLFGSALALRNHGRVTLVEYDDNSREITVPKNGSVLQLAKQFRAQGGTNTATATKRHYAGHDRVIIITDEQSSYDGDPGDVIPANIPLYTWNLGGYKYTGTAGKPLRYTFAGLNDGAFGLIPLLEAGESQNWPF